MKNILMSMAFVMALNFMVYADDSPNLLNASFEKFNEGFPEGLSVIGGASAELLNASLVDSKIGDTAVKVTQFKIEKPEFIRVASAPISNIQVGKNYLCTLNLKVDNFKSLIPDSTEGIRFYIYNSNSGRHAWTQIRHDGSTNGWVTLSMPFSGEYLEPAKGSIFFYIYFNELTGIFQFSDLSVVELPKGTTMNNSFSTIDGAAVGGTVLILK